MDAAGGQKQHYVTLDAARGVAALCVVVFHMLNPTSGPLSGAYLSVDFFFVLSGFVIAHAYEGKLRAGMTIQAFMWKRLERLYPLYLAGFGLGIAFEAMRELQGWGVLAPGELPRVAVAGLFMLPTIGAHDLYPLAIPAWSLFFEVLANLAFAIMAPRLTHRILGAIVAVSAVAVAGLFVLTGALDQGAQWSGVAGGLVRVTFSFFAGVAVYRLRSRLRVVTSNARALAFLLGLLALIVFLPAKVADGAIVLVVLPALVWLGASIQPAGWLERFAAWAGVLSYAIYIVHWPLILIAAFLIHRLPLPAAASPFLIVAACVGASHLAYVDDWARRRRSQRWARPALLNAKA